MEGSPLITVSEENNEDGYVEVLNIGEKLEIPGPSEQDQRRPARETEVKRAAWLRGADSLRDQWQELQNEQEIKVRLNGTNGRKVTSYVNSCLAMRDVCDELMEHPARHHFPPVDRDIVWMDKMVRDYENVLMSKLQHIKEKFDHVCSSLDSHFSGLKAFLPQTREWLKDKLQELDFLGTQYENCRRFLRIKDGDPPVTVCLWFNGAVLRDPYFESLEKGQHISETDDLPAWWKNDGQLKLIAEAVSLFRDFAEANADDDSIVFSWDFWERSDRPLVIASYKRSGGPCYKIDLVGCPQRITTRKHVEDAALSDYKTVHVSWQPPATGAKHVQRYQVSYRDVGKKAEWQSTGTSGTTVSLHHLKRGVKYEIQVTAVTPFGRSPPAFSVKDVVLTKQKLATKYADKVIEPKNDDLPIVIPKMKVEYENKEYRRVYIYKSKVDEKNCLRVLLLGETGSGKSTIINGLANHFYGVEASDNFRLKIVDEASLIKKGESTTRMVTTYIMTRRVDGQRQSLVLIDTPGFGDTAGFQRDEQINETITSYLLSPDPLTKEPRVLHAVGLVVKGPDSKLTPSQEYVFGRIFQMFAKDFEGNIFWLVNFSDKKKPPIIDEVINSETKPFPSRTYFVLNNSSLFSNLEDSDDIALAFWKRNIDGMEKFLNAVQKVKPQSLATTTEVLMERKALMDIIKNLRPHIKKALDKIAEHQNFKEQLEKNEEELKRNKNFLVNVDVQEVKLVDSGEEKNHVTCPKCQENCHVGCGDGWKTWMGLHWCSVMSWGGKCNVCKGRCSASTHHSGPQSYVTVTITVKQTLEDIFKRYQLAMSKHSEFQSLLEKIATEIRNCRQDVLEDIREMHKKIRRLNEIAMRPHGGGLLEYFDELIKAEETDNKPGWSKRVEELKIAKADAEALELEFEVAKSTPAGQTLNPQAAKKKGLTSFIYDALHSIGQYMDG